MRRLAPGRALKPERRRHKRDGECVAVFGKLGHHRGRARACAAAQARRNKHEVRALDCLLQFLPALLGRLFADGRVAAGTKPLGELFPDLDLFRRIAKVKRLLVCVDDDEFRTLETIGYHPVNGIPAAAADADHLNLCKICVFCI